MISSLTGTLRHVDEGRIGLQVGPAMFELLVPAADAPELQLGLGEELTLSTIVYLAGDPSRGALEPTLIGFIRARDKEFFEQFTTVKGIGPRKALRALTVSTGEIAAAIEEKDARFLTQLEGVGKRMAEQIIAELSGKLGKFVTAVPAGVGNGVIAQGRRATFEEDAIAAMMALGERRPDAEHFLDRAKAANPAVKTTDGLLREMLRMRTVRG